MDTNKLRVKNVNLLEDLIYTIKSSTGRFTYLFHFLKDVKAYVYTDSYFPELELKSKKRIFFEQLKHVLKYGEINKFYFVFGLDRKDRNNQNEYMSHQEFIHVRDKINFHPRNFQLEYKLYNFLCLLRDKFTFGAFCKGIGIPTPSNIAIIEKGALQLLDKKEVLPVEGLVNLNINSFCKVFNGGQGKGVFHLEIKEKTIYKDGAIISIEDLKKEFGKHKWILQEKIQEQHDVLNKLYDKSLNTIRLMTVNTGSSIEVLGALLRMGTNGKRIDNWSAGGVVVIIDLSSGALTKWGFFKPGYGTKIEKHPDSGLIFEGYKLPYFEEAISQAKNLHSLLSGIHSIGWDIAITKNGPVFIEGNDNWDVALYQLVNGGNKKTIRKIFND